MNVALKPLLFTICLSIFLCSCGPKKPGTWHNSEIDASTRDKMHELNTQLFAGLKINATDKVESVLTNEQIQNRYHFRQIELISNRMKIDSFALSDEYYMVNKTRGSHSINISDKGVNNHKISYDAQTPEIYIASWTSVKPGNKVLLTAFYNKTDYGWKVSDLEMEPYKVNDKTAPELYQDAKEYAKEGYMVNALNTVMMAKDCANPCTGWSYPEFDGATEFYRAAINAANQKYKFPLVLDGVSSRPRIFRIFNKNVDNITVPAVYYITSVNVEDTAAVRRENNQIKRSINSIIPGFSTGYKYVMYTAFNERPNAIKEPANYSMR